MSFLVNPYSYLTGCDANAVAFLSAAGITDATITSAICTLVTSMKSNGTWDKMNAIYPMVGGTATTHKFNLKNPLNTDAAFRLSFVGGWTHSSGGALPNGTNTYADTFFNPSTSGLLNSHHISYYSRSNVNLNQVEIGVFNNTANSQVSIRYSGVSYFAINNASVFITYTDSDSRAFYIANRTASNILNAWRNSIKVATSNIIQSSSLPINKIYLGTFNNNGIAQFFSTKQCAFATIGTGLTDTEAAALYNSIQAMQTTLSRQV